MQQERRYVAAGETVTVELPWSEVCMHMRVAGRVMQVRLQESRRMNGETVPGEYVAQLVSDSGRDFSFPVLTGEAGFYRDEAGFYTYDARPARHLTLVA